MAEVVGQPEIAPVATEGQSGVVESEQPENGGMRVVDMHPVLRDLQSQFIGGSVGETAPSPAAGHPDRETFRVVIPSRIRPHFARGGGRATKLPPQITSVESSRPRDFGSEINAAAAWSTDFAEFAMAVERLVW